MKPEFSEFTYGYTLIEELSNTYSFKSVPVFPSLREEGRVGGYDAQVNIKGVPFFIQFKRSDYLSRHNAKYYGKFGTTYFRFHLHALRYSKQHDLLLTLERSGKNVFYVAPKFHENTSLNDFYINKKIVDKSIWVRPSEIGALPDDDAHSVCFNSSGKLVLFCSNPREIRIRDFAGVRETISEISSDLDIYKNQPKVDSTEDDQEKDDLRIEWGSLFNEIFQIAFSISPYIALRFKSIESNNMDIVQKTARLARVIYGCEMLII